MSAQLPGSLKRIYDLLIGKKMSLDEIAAAAGIKKETARKYIRQLIRLGLVETDGVYYWSKVEEKKEEKPVEEKKEEKVEEKPKEVVEEKKEVKPVEEKPVEVKEVKPAVEAKPIKIADKFVDVSKALYFYRGINQPVLLSVRSVKQLIVAIENDFIDEEAVSYSIKNGYLQKWLKEALEAPDLATKIDELKDLPPSEIKKKVLEILKSVV